MQTVVARLEESKESASKKNNNNVDYMGNDRTDAQQHQLLPTHDDNDNPELLACFQRIWERGELYKGVGQLAWTLAISNFIYFFINALVKEKILARSCNRQGQGVGIPPHLSLLGSCLAGSINVLFTNPLWVTNLRIISNQAAHPSMAQELVHIVHTMGWRHLWQGTSASLLLVSNPVIQFFCYEQIKVWRLARRYRAYYDRSLSQKPDHLPPMEAFLLGAIAKGVATVVTYPLQLAQAVLRMQKRKQTRQQDGSTQRAGKGIWESLLGIYARDGMKGLYTGMNAKLLQTVLTAAFTFLTYESINRSIARLFGRYFEILSLPSPVGKTETCIVKK